MNLIVEIESAVNRMISNGVISMSKEEYDTCSFISRRIVNDYSLVAGSKDLSLDELISRTLDLFSIYDDKRIADKAAILLDKSRFIIKETDSSSCGIELFSTDIGTIRDNNDLFSLNNIVVPDKYGNLSPIYLGHEVHHAIKDVNPSEYQYMLRYSDVIPMFFEFVCADKVSDEEKSAIIGNRLHILLQSQSSLRDHYTNTNRNIFTELTNSKNAQHLGSFYYAIVLYILYQNDPKKTLNMVKNVLLHEDTTYDMLKRNNIGSNYNNDVSDFMKILQKK